MTKWDRATFAGRKARGDSDSPAPFRPCLSASVVHYGSAPLTAARQRRDALLRLELDRGELNHKAARARDLRQNARAAYFERGPRGVVREILAWGRE